MKTIYLTLLLCLGLLPLAAQNTEFAPIGAKWVRTFGSNMFATGVIVNTVVGDTIIMGNTCSIVQEDWHNRNLSTG